MLLIREDDQNWEERRKETHVPSPTQSWGKFYVH